ncbi:MAG: hypothetical protein ACTSP9_12350 [Promethearchaeota archaeon]
MDLIIFLKDGTQYKMKLDRLIACGTNGNNFFIENKKEGRIETPLDSIDGFKIETTRTYLLHDDNNTKLITAVGILSKHSI